MLIPTRPTAFMSGQLLRQSKETGSTEAMSESEQTEGAANHVDQALGTIEQVFDGLGKRAAAFKDRARREAAEIHATFDLADKVVNDRMVDANRRFRKFLGAGSNFPPAIEDKSERPEPMSPTIESKGEDAPAQS